MRLTDLKPEFLKFVADGSFFRTDIMEGADGLKFLCPKCYTANNGPEGTHSVICWFEDRVPPEVSPAPGRWKPVGTDYTNLSFVPGKQSCSVLLLGGCNWHGFITNGEVSLA